MSRSSKVALFRMAATLALALAGCAQPPAGVSVHPSAAVHAIEDTVIARQAPAKYRGSGQVAMTFSRAHATGHYHLKAALADIARIVVTLRKAKDVVLDASVTADQLAAGSTTVQFTDLAAATYSVEIAAYDDADAVIGLTTRDVAVQADGVTRLDAHLQLNAGAASPGTGGMAVDVSIDDPTDAASPAPSALPTATPTEVPGASTAGPGRGFPEAGPWVSFYGAAEKMRDLAKVASTFRVINLDADSDAANFTPVQIQQLKAGGKNRVISYFNLGAVEKSRTYWTQVPPGFVPAGQIKNLGDYQGYPDEVWMDLSSQDWHHLVVDYLAPRLVAQGIDGFYFDNLELLEHAPDDTSGPGSPAVTQGGMDLVRELRAKYPNLLFVMQNGTSDVTRLGKTGGADYASLLDGVAHEEVFSSAPATDDATTQTYGVQVNDGVVAELSAWKGLNLQPGGRPFWIATEDYANTCTNTAATQQIYQQSRAKGFSPYVSDKSAGQGTVCFWGF